ncbi:MAG: (Fe-S)-binding protein [Planctomycetota bacterium]|nr:(Fe-S)-binding protein [Planctomycetota bacterium]
MAISADREQKFRQRFDEYARTLDCVHCGLCIPDCPTYGITGKEASSPRGRIYLMRGYAEDNLELSSEVLRHLDECIVCRACETVCPSGIRMGDMMESFRGMLDEKRTRKGLGYRLSRFLLRHVLPYRQRIAFLTDLMWLYERLGLRRLVRLWAGRFAPRFAALDRLQPVVPPPAERRIETDSSLPSGYHPALGKPRMRVALFLGCIASEWFAPTHRATIRVLRRNGCDVLVPDAQTCCGALHRHAGVLGEAEDLYRKNRECFVDSGADVVVVNAAGCGAALKDRPDSVPDGLGVPVRDVCELLDEIGIVPPTGRIEKRVVYDAPCHLLHGQRIGKNVVEDLLRQIPGLELRDLPESDRCCGSGGVYNLVHPHLARPILDEKIAAIVSVEPDIVVTGNPGCVMQIRSGLDGTAVEVLHPIELLDRSYGGPAFLTRHRNEVP